MIVTEFVIINDKQFTKTYSDRRMMIHGGEPEADYDFALDPTEFNRAYVETDIPIIEADISDEEALNIILGGAE